MKFKNRDPLIVCICGQARSGKDLVGKFIYDEYVNNNYKAIVSPYTKYLKKYIS